MLYIRDYAFGWLGIYRYGIELIHLTSLSACLPMHCISTHTAFVFLCIAQTLTGTCLTTHSIACLLIHCLASKSLPVVQLTDVSGKDVLAADSNGMSDVYLRFFTNPPGVLGKKKVKTPVKEKTLNPKWDDSEVPELRPLVASVAELAKVTLIVALFDKDTMSKNDALGVVRIPLQQGIDGPFTVDEPIVKGTLMPCVSL